MISFHKTILHKVWYNIVLQFITIFHYFWYYSFSLEKTIEKLKIYILQYNYKQLIPNRTIFTQKSYSNSFTLKSVHRLYKKKKKTNKMKNENFTKNYLKVVKSFGIFMTNKYKT